ncbi:MAG TPA: hypothetical protein ENK49_06175 [Gammaproteobacteria bacterium]|nr:hypothetical protein [Gammaproteobacteria bacterium]
MESVQLHANHLFLRLRQEIGGSSMAIAVDVNLFIKHMVGMSVGLRGPAAMGKLLACAAIALFIVLPQVSFSLEVVPGDLAPR